MKAREPITESVRGRLLPAIEPLPLFDGHLWELVILLAVIWILVFGLLTVVLSFALSHLNGMVSIEMDAARAATLVDVALLILLKMLPQK